MRSMATPNDHIDMKNKMKATAFATHPICCHIAIKSTVNPPCLLRRVSSSFVLLQGEVHGYRHDDGHGHAVQQRRRELPLAHGVERGGVEQGNLAEHLGFLHR